MSRTKLFAVAAAMLLAMTALAPAAVGAAQTNGNDTVGNAGLSIGVSQGADRVTVSVSNATTGESVENASVDIDSNNSYNVSGLTDEDGIAVFDAPNETVNATITAEKDNMSATKTVTLRASEGQGPSFTPFGQKIAAYVHGLTAGTGPIGPVLADFITDRAGPPDHAGPPEHANASENAGPPDHAGPPEHAGPPDHAGPSDDADSQNGGEDEEADEEDDE